MKQVVFLAALFFLSACNDPHDVVIVADQFSHTAQFEERDLTVQTFLMEDVKAEMTAQGAPVTSAQIAINYAAAINSMAAGTVVLNFAGGYDGVYAALNKYDGRRIYCAGASYWGVSVPDGCIPISNVYSKLNELAPISLAQWEASGSAPSIVDSRLPTYRALYDVWVLDNAQITNAKAMRQQVLEYRVIDGRSWLGNQSVEQLKTNIGCYDHYVDCESYEVSGSVAAIIARNEINGTGDDSMYAGLSYFIRDGAQPNCEYTLHLGSLHRSVAEALYTSPIKDEVVSEDNCWLGPIEEHNGLPFPDFSVIGL